jgi:iron complex transport system substrate-binding protein
MRRFWPLIIFAVILVISTISQQNKSLPTASQPQQVKRIISLSPSITETLFAVGAGNKVVGVTKFCDYPAAAQSIAKVGGFIDPNIEAIIALQPDLVILLASHNRLASQLKQLKIPTLVVKNRRVAEIKNTISVIGKRIGHREQAKQLLASIEQKQAFIAAKTKDQAKPRVMIAMGHSIGSEKIKKTYIAGNQDFYNDLIQLAGGVNAYQGVNLQVPSVSIEGIMQINPQVIIDIFPEADDHSNDLNQVLHAWQQLSHVNAVINKRVYLIEKSYATIPGPRIVLLLEDIARLLHPEINWSTSPT